MIITFTGRSNVPQYPYVRASLHPEPRQLPAVVPTGKLVADPLESTLSALNKRDA